jgi:flavin-dependent dehydrogenase
MAQSINSDVLVIGGGPAGTAAAITCARAGLTVRLIEAERFPRHRPGETLHPGVEPLLERLDVAARVSNAGFLRHAGVWVERSGKREFQAYGVDDRGPWLGFQACRSEFDALLLAKAQSTGVTVYQPHRALRLIRDGERIAGAESTIGNIHAAITIDATGSLSWLSRQLSLHRRPVSRKLVALYGYMRGDCPARDAAPLFTFLPGGWVWTARVRPNLYHWTRLSATDAPLNHTWTPPEFAGLRPLGRPKGADVSWRRLEACAGPGYFVVGDAATVSDPSTSHGVLRALMSGMLAGHLVVKRATQCWPEPWLAREYRRYIHRWFEFDWTRAADLTQLRQPEIKMEQPNEDHVGLWLS